MTGRPSPAAQHALDLLGAERADDAASVRRAFHRAVKSTHPDRPGGDAARFRAVIEAYRLLAESAPGAFASEVGPGSREGNATKQRDNPEPARPEPASAFAISPAQAMLGGDHVVEIEGGGHRIQLPAGLRHGDRVRIGDTSLSVRVHGDAAASVIGDHLCLTIDVEPGLIDNGGRLTLATPKGPLTLWISPGDAARGLTRVHGEGLPARAGRPQGDLFIRLRPASRKAESPARTKRRRFAADWAA